MESQSTCSGPVQTSWLRYFEISSTCPLRWELSPCLKSAIIEMMLKKTHNINMNDYQHVALTPIIMKCFETLVLPQIKPKIPSTLDSHQFAHRGNRSTEDSISLAFHSVLMYLEKQEV